GGCWSSMQHAICECVLVGGERLGVTTGDSCSTAIDIVQTVLGKCGGSGAFRNLARFLQHLQGTDNHGVDINLEEAPCCGTSIGETEIISTQRSELVWHVLADLVWQHSCEISSCHDRCLSIRHYLSDVWNSGFGSWIGTPFAFCGYCIAAQFVPASNRPSSSRDAPVIGQYFGGFNNPWKRNA